MMNVEQILMSLKEEDVTMNDLEMLAENMDFVKSVYNTIKNTMDDEYENYVSMDGVQAMLRAWADNNEGLYALLGNKLKVSKTYMANATYNDFESDFSKFLDSMYCGFETKKDGRVAINILTMRNAHHMNVGFGFSTNPVCNLIEYVTLRNNYDDVVANRVNANAYEVQKIVKALDMKRSPEGKKLTKWMREVLIATTEKLYANNAINDDEKTVALKEADVICQYYSRIIEKIKTSSQKEHTVYVSIDPHDYFRCSYGTDWQSCHQVGNMHGDGAIQYCENGTTLIAYEEKIEDDMDVNPLKWRQIIYTNDYYSRFVGSRQYKTTNKENARIARELIMECVEKFKNASVEWDLVDYTTSEDVQRTIKPYVLTGEYDYAYNDVKLYGGLDQDLWMVSKKNSECDACYVNRNDSITCLDCGQRFEGHRDYFFMCENCGGGVYCEICGCYHSEDDVTYVEDAEGYVCYECLEENFAYCRDCGEWHRIEDMTEYSYNSGEYICENCIILDYAYCEECECYEYADRVEEYYDENGASHFVCDDCKCRVIVNCDKCGCEFYSLDSDVCMDCMENEDEQ